MPDPVNDEITRLVDGWCERRDLKALRLILRGWPMSSGLTDDWALVMEALRDLRAWGGLPPDEQDVVERLLPLVEKVVYRT